MKKRLSSFGGIVLGLIVAALALFTPLSKFMGGFKWIAVVVGGLISVYSFFELKGMLFKRKPSEPQTVEQPEKQLAKYTVKATYISRQEWNFLQLLEEVAGDKYKVIPQVALNSVIDKLTQNAYRNELFRVIDFLFVDKTSYAPKILIELNDSSHLKSDRIERDKKVADICGRAGMPLVTFWTNQPNSFTDVKKVIMKNMRK